MVSGRNAEGHVTEGCNIKRRCLGAFIVWWRLRGYETTRGSMSLSDGEEMLKAHGAICTRCGKFCPMDIRCGTRQG